VAYSCASTELIPIHKNINTAAGFLKGKMISKVSSILSLKRLNWLYMNYSFVYYSSFLQKLPMYRTDWRVASTALPIQANLTPRATIFCKSIETFL